MTLRTSCFDKSIFVKTLRRFWPLWAAYLCVWLLCLPLDLHSTYQWDTVVEVYRVQRTILRIAAEGSLFIPFIAAPLASMAVFSHLYNDRSCGAYASLPVKRERMFLSVMLAGLVPLVAAHVLTAAVTLGVEAQLGCVEWTALLSWLAVTTLNTVTFYGFAVLCAQLTGNTLVVPAVYVVLSFTATVVQLIVGTLCELFLYGHNGTTGALALLLTPVVMLSQQCGYSATGFTSVADGYEHAVSYVFDGWPAVILYAAAGAVLLVVAGLLYRRRRMEAAGDIVAVRALRPVFKYALAGGCALVLGMLMAGMFYNDVHDTVMGIPLSVGMSIFCLLGGFVGYFGAEMLNRKTFRVFTFGWKGFGIFSLAVIAGLCTLHFDLTGFETRIPNPAKVEQVYISLGGYSVTCTGENIPEAIALHEAVIETRDADRTRDADWQGTRYVSVRYAMKNGSELVRRYDVPVSQETEAVLRQAEDLLNSPAARESRGFSQENLTPEWFYSCTVDSPHGQLALNNTEAYAFYTQCVLPDLRDGKLDRVWVLDDSQYRETSYDATVSLYIRNPATYKEEHDTSYESLHLQPTTESSRINKWLQDRDYPLTLPEYQYYEKFGDIYASPDSYTPSVTVEPYS